MQQMFCSITSVRYALRGNAGRSWPERFKAFAFSLVGGLRNRHVDVEWEWLFLGMYSILPSNGIYMKRRVYAPMSFCRAMIREQQQ